MDNNCLKFRRTSNEISEWINIQPSVKEESLTDCLIKNIIKYFNDEIIVYDFNKREEGGAKGTGADLYVLSILDDGFVEVLIQAKMLRLDPRKNQDALEFGSDSKSAISQIELLKKFSEKLDSVALYLYYSNVSPNQSLCKSGLKSSLQFISLESAFQLREIGRKSGAGIKAEAILKKSFSAGCWFCCRLWNNVATPSQFFETWAYNILDQRSSTRLFKKTVLPIWAKSKIFNKEDVKNWVLDRIGYQEVFTASHILLIDLRSRG